MTPYGDGTGPNGAGPRTGRRAGKCARSNQTSVSKWSFWDLFRRQPAPEPSAPKPAEKRSLFAVVDRTLCTECGMCVDICSFSAVALVDDRVTISEAGCTGCGACARSCPQDAIRMVER